MTTATTTRPINRCACGARISKYATVCNACHRARLDAIHAEAAAIVATGVCPDCGTPLVRNSAIAGWWQCGAYACESHRRPEYRGLPKCSFQIFTE